MAQYSTNEFRSGLKVLLDNEPCNIVENEFVKPGKGQAFNRVKLRNLISGRIWERTFKSGEKIDAADVFEFDATYLYSDGEFWHFMRNDDTFEQVAVTQDQLGKARCWVQEESICTITVWNDIPIDVTVPNFVELEVAETDPGLKGDTATGGSKAAELSTGASIRVPLFINIGDIIKIDTRTESYVSRVVSK